MNRSRLAGLLIVCGLALNSWVLGRVFASDGQIESLAVRSVVAVFDATLITAGALLLLGRVAWVLNATLVIVSVATTLVVLEGSFRILGIKPHYPTQRRNMVLRAPNGPAERAPHAFIPLSTARSTYGSDPRGYFGPGHSIDHVHNSAGWRDIEHSLEKPPGVLRVMGLGDSYLYGRGVRYEDIVLTRVGKMLEAANSDGVSVETINTGVPGTNTVDQRDLLRERGWEYDPDLVILFFVLNDVEQNLSERRPTIDFFRNYTAVYQDPDALSRFSMLWGWGRQRVQTTWGARTYGRRSVATFVENHAGWLESREALNDIHRQAQERDVPLLVVIFPFFHELDGEYPLQVIHDMVRAHCVSVGIPVLDLRDQYRRYNGPELRVHETDQHPNEIAHEIAADATTEYILSRQDWAARLWDRPVSRGPTELQF